MFGQDETNAQRRRHVRNEACGCVGSSSVVWPRMRQCNELRSDLCADGFYYRAPSDVAAAAGKTDECL